MKKANWYWVTGNMEKGFKVVTTRPRSKEVREPFESYEAAQRSIAYEIMMSV